MPKTGDEFLCPVCGMEIRVIRDCKCPYEEHVHFHCCGDEMYKKAEGEGDE